MINHVKAGKQFKLNHKVGPSNTDDEGDTHPQILAPQTHRVDSIPCAAATREKIPISFVDPDSQFSVSEIDAWLQQSSAQGAKVYG